MDITPLFKACVKTVRLKNRSLPAPDKNRILKKTSRNEFSKRTHNISQQITEFKNFLVENRSAYMQIGFHLKNSAQMTDEERDIIDVESENVIKICTQLIQEFKLEVMDRKHMALPKQYREHIDSVIEIISSYLKSVNNIFNGQKNYRIQREIETYKLLKLDSDKKRDNSVPHYSTIPADDLNQDSESDYDDYREEKSSKMQNKKKLTPLLSNNPIAAADDLNSRNGHVMYDEEDEDQLSPEDIQMFESENLQLYNELRGLSEEVEQIEKNVVDIAKLQDILTENVSIIVFF